MPSWKRVIVSGSNAVLNQISASGNIVPATDNGSDLGASNLEWKDLYIDGTAYLDSADIDGGDIASGVTINKSPVVNFNSGDVQGSITLTNLASGTGALTIQANSVALTTDTTGNYVQKVTVGTGLGGAVDSEGGTAAMTLDAAQTVITSVVNSGLEIGRDADNRIKFGTDNQIIFEVDTGDNVIFKTAGEIEATSLDISGGVDIAGAITSAEWTGDVIASAYLDADTAHLSTTQTFSGAKSFTLAVNIDATTAASSKTTGALIVDGGVGVALDVHAGGDVVAYASSDERLKDNLQVIQDPLDKVGQISGYEFDWNEESPEWAQERGHDIGIVAQEIQKVLPEIVTERTNGYLGVDYKRIIPLLIESVKELKQEIENLKKKVN